MRKSKVGAVGSYKGSQFKVEKLSHRLELTCLIPSLNGSGDRIENDGVIECPRVFPAIGCLLSQILTILRAQLWDVIVLIWSLGHQGSLLQERKNIVQIVLLCIVFDIAKELISRNTTQWVLDAKVERSVEKRRSKYWRRDKLNRPLYCHIYLALMRNILGLVHSIK